MAAYTFEENPADQEWRRLRLIEQALDKETIDRLRDAGIQPGWRCLELGAGAGSIAQWMSSVVGDRGQVVAIDINTNHLQRLAGVRFAIVAGDFLDVTLDGQFDLAHCRYVLIHNKQSQPMLNKLVELLQPGGILVVEEPDFTSARLLNNLDDPSQQRVNNAICRMFENLDLDPAFGLGLPQKVAAAGLHVLRVDSRVHLDRGGSPIVQMMAESTRALQDKYVATGEAILEDIERYIENASNDQFWSVYFSTVTVVAAKPT